MVAALTVQWSREDGQIEAAVDLVYGSWWGGYGGSFAIRSTNSFFNYLYFGLQPSNWMHGFMQKSVKRDHYSGS